MDESLCLAVRLFSFDAMSHDGLYLKDEYTSLTGTEVILMHKAYIVTGTLTDVHTVTLDEALPLNSTKVRLVVEPLEHESQRPYQEVIAEIRERQRARGHQPATREEIDAYLQAERDTWEK
jgi:hypothetical protein